MPSFLSKLFRRKGGGGSGSDEKRAARTKRGGRGSHRGIRTKSSKEKALENPQQRVSSSDDAVLQPKKDDNHLNQQQQQQHPHHMRTPTAVTTSTTGALSDRSSTNSSRLQQQQQPHLQSPTGVSSPRNQRTAAAGVGVDASKSNKRGSGPVDLDDTDNLEESDAENRDRGHSSSSPRLSFHQLQQFNRQSGGGGSSSGGNAHHHLYVHSPNLMDQSLEHGGNGSDASSSDFNLSTDAEDTEYNNLRRRGGAPPPPPPPQSGGAIPPYSLNTSANHLDTSGLSAMSSPTNYTTDEETHAIFPALPQTDDESASIHNDNRSNNKDVNVVDSPLHSHHHPDDEGGSGLRIMPMAHETEDDMRAWTVSPTSASASDTTNHKKKQQQASSPKFSSFSKKSKESSTGGATPNVVEVERAPTTTSNDAFKEAFGNFANFDDVFPMDQQQQQQQQPKSTSRSNKATRAFLVEAPSSPDVFAPHRSRPNRASSSASASAHQETSLSDLLAQAKRKSSRSSSKRGSSSVNSAPVITSQYLRETHKLGSHSHRSSGGGDSRSVDKTTSVSDIIQSLEATNASRLKSSSRGGGSRSSSSHHHHHHHSSSRRSDFDTHSHTSNGGTSTRSAKERLREKRRQERNARNNMGGSDDSDDNEEAESWLFDEVTGALGPRGVAADMESLGGRSKNSTGNKSHRSHRSHKSHRSHRSSRRKKSSSESVDSRNSRNSRYSHRSTRSYLSQMSEQSRSVANDLLRLEMQLAMVGSQDVNDDTAGKTGTSGSVSGSTGGASRASRTSRTSRNAPSSSARRASSVSKRSKMTVIAPPGKLGIILANKADSKGTVVSGVRTSSVLSEKISPGDRIIAIDGEDVSLMTVSEITTIMARKSDFERQLTIMTTPKHLGLQSRGDYGGEADGYYRR